MDQTERRKVWTSAIEEGPMAAGSMKIYRGFGISNRPAVVESGLELIDADMDSLDLDDEERLPDVFVFTGTINLPPHDELFIAVYVESESRLLVERLRGMLETGKNRNNNVAILAASRDGKLYLRNKGRWIDDPSTFDLDRFLPAITPDRVEVAIYPPQRDAIRSLNARFFISYLGKLFRQERIHEVHPWERDEAGFEKYRCDLGKLGVEKLEKAVAELGAYYAGNLVERYHIALNYLKKKHFVILSGISGTGKTNLAIRYAQAAHGITEASADDPFLFVCPVRPDWTDPTGLLGYHDIVSGRYVVPEFLEALLMAHAYPGIPVFVCIDELNIARVEYYLSDILSCTETGLPLRLHHNSIPLEGSNGEDIPSSLPIPPNLYLTGTINIDETTQPISDKVLDRAIVIDMSKVDIKGFLENLRMREFSLAKSIRASMEILVGLYDMLMPQRLGFGYRIAEEFVRYVSYATANSKSGTTEADIIDHLIAQKILTKLRGSERQRDMLTGLSELLTRYSQSQEIVTQLASELDELGSFQNMR